MVRYEIMHVFAESALVLRLCNSHVLYIVLFFVIFVFISSVIAFLTKLAIKDACYVTVHMHTSYKEKENMHVLS